MKKESAVLTNRTAPIVIEGITKKFASGSAPALNSLSAKIRGGGITGLVGPDGAGKTTLLRLICGLLLPDEGQISVLGNNTVSHASQIHSLVGYMPQKFGLYEDLTVIENMNLYADLRNVPLEERKERYQKLLEFTNLASFTKRMAGRLSGGMKQKLGLACTLLAQPPILLLDEPGVGVDPVARRELWRMMRALLTPDRVVVWSTAYLDEAEACDDVLLLNEGELLYEGTPGNLSQQVDGQVFLIDAAGKKRRSLVVPLMEKEQTLDAVIQGSKVRVVTRDNGDELLKSLPELSHEMQVNLELKPTSPRFEDAFIKMLGGARRGNPAISSFWKINNSANETVRADNLTRCFGKFVAVDDVSFSIQKGEIFGLLGPNGAGKSTTFKMMCGLLTPSSGNCSIVGVNFRDAPGKARSRLGYMAQKFSLYGDLSVLQNLNFFSSVYGLQGKERKATVERIIETFDLSPYLKASAQNLPLGFKQRLAMGCAVMHGPDVLFLDEPTSGVDPVTRREFWTYINSAALRGVTIMVTTHFMDEAEYCDRIALIYKGKMIASGSPDELKAGISSPLKPDPTLEETFVELIERVDSAE